MTRVRICKAQIDVHGQVGLTRGKSIVKVGTGVWCSVYDIYRALTTQTNAVRRATCDTYMEST
jgi:hypothetical protein